MAKTDFDIPSLGDKFIDLRDSIPGDSYNWSWVRPLSQVNYLAIHHTAAPDSQTPNEIASFHINSNGWGGIGYHFVISKDGVVYYVGDISTARANVANLNEQVIGICLTGNFTDQEPTPEQINSARLLCDFFINNYPSLTNIQSWEAVKGHKELPGQSTACPGNTWPSWKGKITSGSLTPPGSSSGGGSQPVVTPPPTGLDRGAQISELYRKVLGRDPDMGGLQTYTNGPLTIDEIMRAMVFSDEHQKLISLGKEAEPLKSQVASLQSSLGLVNDQLINLQQTIAEKDQEIIRLKSQSNMVPPPPLPADGQPAKSPAKADTTLTIFQALFNLYKFVFMPGKEAPFTG